MSVRHSLSGQDYELARESAEHCGGNLNAKPVALKD